MEKKQLPVEVVEQIKAEAKVRGKNHMFIPMDGDYSSHSFHGFIVERTYETCATAYATKLLEAEEKIKELERQNEKLKAQATGWRPLLEKVLHRHEGGLLPDRLLYLKIKTFLYGE